MKSTLFALVAAVALVACGKKEDVTTKQDAQNVPATATPAPAAPAATPVASEPAKTEEAKK